MTYLGHHVILTWGEIWILTCRGNHVYGLTRLDETNTMVPNLPLETGLLLADQKQSDS